MYIVLKINFVSGHSIHSRFSEVTRRAHAIHNFKLQKGSLLINLKYQKLNLIYFKIQATLFIIETSQIGQRVPCILGIIPLSRRLILQVILFWLNEIILRLKITILLCPISQLKLPIFECARSWLNCAHFHLLRIIHFLRNTPLTIRNVDEVWNVLYVTLHFFKWYIKGARL